MTVAMLGGYADIPALAGIFSGWIVAIVAFYFMEEATDRAGLSESRRKLDAMSNDDVGSVDERMSEKDALIEGLKERVNELADVVTEYEHIVSALNAKLNGRDAEGDEG